MKYLIRLLAAIPMIGAGIAIIWFMVMSFDEWPYILVSIANVYTFMVCAHHYEESVRILALFIKRMAVDALTE